MEIERGEDSTTASVIVKKIVNADRERVFEAWTNPEMMQHWFVGAKGRAQVAVDLRVGGEYSNEMFIEGKGTCQEEGPPSGRYLHHGKYLEIIRPERLVFSWNSPFVQNTTVTVELREVESGTEVTITHQLNAPSECEGHRGGWTYALGSLGDFLSGGVDLG